MSTLLRRLQRDPKFQKQEPTPAPAPLDTTQLNEALAELIKQAAAAGAEEAVKKQPVHNPAVPVHRQPFTSKPESHEFPPAPPTTAAPKDLTVSLQRNEVGRVKSVSIGQTNFIVQRDSEGRVVRMVQEEN